MNHIVAGKGRIIVVAVACAVLFLALRLPGIGLAYYQDEWKNVASSATVAGAGQFFAHPPLMQMLFVLDYKLFGQDAFRVLPLIFSLASVVLLYFAVRRRAGVRAAGWAVFLSVFCFYNILGAIQPDVDGSVLPFFFLLAAFAYEKVTSMSVGAPLGRVPGAKAKWLMILFVASLLAAMLTKLSAILMVGVFVLDFLWRNRKDRLLAHVGLAAGFGAVLVVMYVALLYLIQAIYPAFSIQFMLGHAHQFSEGHGRNWLQIAVQGIKALYYLSPLMIAPLVFISRDVLRKTRIYWLYLVLGFIFYFVLFDFSQGALDKYLMFSIIPLAVINGIILAEAVFSNRKQLKWGSLTGLVAALIILKLNWLHPALLALYPKMEWFGHVLHGQWNILSPINGGSGPMGFYVSFLFIAVSFIAAVGIAAVSRILRARARNFSAAAMIAVIAIGLAYNFVFAEEYFHGRINGSAPAVLSQAISFLQAHPEIGPILSYNDIGNQEVSALGRYAGRFYAAPQFEEGHRQLFAKFAGYYMIVDVPHIYENSFYGQYFAACKAVWNGSSGRIAGAIYSCPHAAAAK